ncbi:hypothetical protein RND81_06G215900 [Saponaria officinalis]|uniref:RRM domain-containing protein n=1 Tax=Saponaria officinalis TaxID=3572 RepID=A0AAW1KEG3_SAPOF
MSVKTVKVSNVSLKASEQELKEFFSFSGEIEYLETKSEDDETVTAYVSFKDSQGADTAVLLTEGQNPQSALRKAEDVVSNMLAKGFTLGKDAVGKAKSFDEKHQLTSTASLKIASLDQKIGFTEKINMGTSAVNNKVKEIDEKFQVSEKTKTALSVAEEKVSNAGSAIIKNRYVLTGATWVTGAFNKVAKAANEVGQKTKERVGMVDDEQKRKVVDDFARVHLSEPDSPDTGSPKALSPVVSSPKESLQNEQQPTKPEPVQGLVL